MWFKDAAGNISTRTSATITLNSASAWTKQLDTDKDAFGEGIAVDGNNNVYVTGFTRGGLDGNTNVGGSDIFTLKYDTNGNKQ